MNSPQQPPATPTLSLPSTGTSTVSLTPTFKTVSNDVNLDDIQYEVKICTDSGMSTGCSTFTAANAGWSGANVGTTSYSSGTTATYIVQVGNSLAPNTTYFWKTRAIDPTGSNTWSGTQITAYSFTTNQFPTSPDALLIEAQSSPVLSIIDTTPEFSAVFNDPDTTDTSAKYQIQVDDNSSYASPYWDSGSGGTAMSSCNEGARCSDISYAGSALSVGTTYYWRIKYWDSIGNTSPWSAGTPYFTINSPAVAPTLIIPSNNATGVTLTPTFRTVSTDIDNNPLQYKLILATNATFTGTTQVFNQTVSNIGWSAQNVGTSAYSSGTTATYIIQVGNSLAGNTMYYWKTQAIDYSGTNTWSALSIGYSFTTLNRSPNQPTNTTPGVGVTAVSLIPTLIASAFSDPDAGDTQTASQFQVATDSGFTSIVFDTGITGPASNSVSVSPALSVGTTYYWRVRYKDNYSGWSSYSTQTAFVTNKTSLTPTLSLPLDTATNQSLTPTLKTVTTDPDGNSLQYEVKICTDSGMSTGCSTFTAANAGWSGANVGTTSYSSGTTATYIVQVGNSLAPNTTYFWKTRAIDPTGSNTWSGTQVTAYSFVTGEFPTAPATPTLIWPPNGAIGQPVTPTFRTVSTDINLDSIQYEVKICTNSIMTTGCSTFTAANAGWSGADVGTTSYSSSTTATYIVQVGNSLAPGVTYYWKTRAIDPPGSNTWSGTQVTPFSFTTFINNSFKINGLKLRGIKFR